MRISDHDPCRGGPACRRAGFTVLELLVAIVLVGLLTALALPRVREGLRRSELRSAASAVSSLPAQARLAAIQRNRRATIRVSGSRLWVETAPRMVALAGSTADTVGGVLDVSARFGATLSASQSSLAFDARGFGTTPSATFRLALFRQGDSSVVTINGLGRVQ